MNRRESLQRIGAIAMASGFAFTPEAECPEENRDCDRPENPNIYNWTDKHGRLDRPRNWSKGRVPQGDDDVLIDSTGQHTHLHGKLVCRNLWLTGNEKIVFWGDWQLYVSNNITADVEVRWVDRRGRTGRWVS